MFSTLRSRLLSSYLLLLIITLLGILMTLFITVSAQQAPPQVTYDRLVGTVRGLNLVNVLQDFNQASRPQGQGQGGRLGERDIYETIETETILNIFADRQDVRVLIVNVSSSRVLYDSLEIIELTEEIEFNVDNYQSSNTARLNLPQNSDMVFGNFIDEQDSWLFSGVTFGPRNVQNAILVADIKPSISLQTALAEFAESLAQPVIQSAIIGLIIAIVMASVISRTIARPLQAVSEAATAIAMGDLEQAVPVSGPAEVRAVAEAFNTMSEEVRDTQQAQQDFMANVSHDLKTPLTSIQGYSMAIMDGTMKDPKQAAEIIHDEASRLTRMVIELTDLARLQAGSLSIHFSEINLSDIAKVVAQKLAVVARDKQITLRVDTEPIPTIAGDGDRLVQVLNNLIGNAIKYTPKGGTVLVKTQQVADGVEVIIQDTGVGIPAKDLARIFERFYQVDKARGPQRGTGLGLAITHEIVEAHGGNIHVKSEVDKGTRFTIWFPDPKARTVISNTTRSIE